MKVCVFGVSIQDDIEELKRNIRKKLGEPKLLYLETDENLSLENLVKSFKNVLQSDCVVFRKNFPETVLTLQIYEILWHFKIPMYYEIENGLMSEPLVNWFKGKKGFKRILKN